jgi:Fe-S-cluster containining protein
MATPYEDLMHGALNAVKVLVQNTLGRERSVNAAVELATRTIEISELMMSELARLHPPERPIACSRGCDACCKLTKVATDVPSVVRIVMHAQQHFSEAELLDLRDRILPGGKESDAPGCAWLANRACTVYPVRPVVCRVFNAFDVNQCNAGNFIDPHGDEAARKLAEPHRVVIGAAIQDGLRQGLEGLGIDGRQVYLRAASLRLLSQGDAFARWVKGERVFEDITAGVGAGRLH